MSPDYGVRRARPGGEDERGIAPGGRGGHIGFAFFGLESIRHLEHHLVPCLFGVVAATKLISGLSLQLA